MPQGSSMARHRVVEARSLLRSHRLHEAAWSFAEAVSTGVDAAIWLEYAQVLAKLEDHRAALAAFDHALAGCDQACAWNDRGVSLIALGREQEATRSFERALRSDARFAPALANLAALRLSAGDTREALRLFEQAVQKDEKHVLARLGLGRSLASNGRPEEAERELARASRLAPASFDVLLASVAFWSSRRKLSQAIARCQRFLRHSPRLIGALGLWLELRVERGEAAASALLSPERWLRVQDLDFDAKFHSRLVRGVLDTPSLLYAPPRHATRNGRHTGALSSLEQVELARLEAAMEQALLTYVAAHQQDPDWPRLRPSSVALHCWGVLLEADGFQKPHLHPDAWLSGVYYAAVPETAASALVSRAGQLELGRPDPELGFERERPSYFVAPKPGRLVIFPSWLYHSTIPHGCAGARVSIAFDCVISRLA
jgi:uncharacterized protein (TIGR02466 family)